MGKYDDECITAGILTILLAGGSRTVMEVAYEFQTARLSAYVCTLRHRGIPIESLPIPGSLRVRYRIPPEKLVEMREKYGA